MNALMSQKINESFATVHEQPLEKGVRDYLSSLVAHQPVSIQFNTGSGHIFYDLLLHWPIVPEQEDCALSICHWITETVYPFAATMYAQAVDVTIFSSPPASLLPLAAQSVTTCIHLDIKNQIVRVGYLAPNIPVPAVLKQPLAEGLTILCRPLNYFYHTIEDSISRYPSGSTSNLPVRHWANRNRDKINQEIEKASYPTNTQTKLVTTAAKMSKLPALVAAGEIVGTAITSQRQPVPEPHHKIPKIATAPIEPSRNDYEVFVSDTSSKQSYRPPSAVSAMQDDLLKLAADTHHLEPSTREVIRSAAQELRNIYPTPATQEATGIEYPPPFSSTTQPDGRQQQTHAEPRVLPITSDIHKVLPFPQPAILHMHSSSAPAASRPIRLDSVVRSVSTARTPEETKTPAPPMITLPSHAEMESMQMPVAIPETHRPIAISEPVILTNKIADRPTMPEPSTQSFQPLANTASSVTEPALSRLRHIVPTQLATDVPSHEPEVTHVVHLEAPHADIQPQSTTDQARPAPELSAQISEPLRHRTSSVTEPALSRPRHIEPTQLATDVPSHEPEVTHVVHLEAPHADIQPQLNTHQTIARHAATSSELPILQGMHTQEILHQIGSSSFLPEEKMGDPLTTERRVLGTPHPEINATNHPVVGIYGLSPASQRLVMPSRPTIQSNSVLGKAFSKPEKYDRARTTLRTNYQRLASLRPHHHVYAAIKGGLQKIPLLKGKFAPRIEDNLTVTDKQTAYARPVRPRLMAALHTRWRHYISRFLEPNPKV
jgi:hypothetical protein